MYMSLSDLRAKFLNDQPFAIQFVNDALEVGIAPEKVDILDNLGGKVDETKLYGNNDLLHTYVEAVKEMTVSENAQGKARLYAYLHAPWDEPEFTVDTNSRVITVPSEFTKNGVGVTGDHLAEILFFRLPRFYDVVDLYGMTSTNIYWYNGGNKGTTTYYKNTPAVIYAEDEELVLGWAISQLATAAAGTIEFFLEFEHVIEGEGEHAGEVDFRLETQPAKLTVKSTLELDKDGVEIEQYNDIVYSRAIYSPIINTLTASPARIIKNLPEGKLDFDPETNNITFLIDAVSPDDATLLYQWNWNSIMVDQPEGELINSGSLPNVTTYILATPKDIQFDNPAYGTVITPATEDRYDLATGLDESVSPVEAGLYELVEEEYVLSEDTEFDSEKAYYTFVPGSAAVIEPAADTTYRTLTTNVPGIYQVYVGNQTANGGIRYVYSNIVVIDPASEIALENALPNEIYADNLTAENGYAVRVSGQNGVLTYQWFHGDEAIEGANEATYYPTQTYLATQAEVRGEYWVRVTNTKNNTITTVDSNKSWVEMVPTKIADTDLIVAPVDTEDDTEWSIIINNIPYDDATYEMYATVDVQEIKNNEQRTTTYEVAGSRKAFAGATTTLSLDGVQQLEAGTKYALNVYVVPTVTLPHTSQKRYPEVSPNVPAYTWKATEVLIKK